MKTLDADLARQWMSICHIALLNALIAETRFSCSEIAFQGGTSLHLTKGSPRFSEDLDFLLAKEAVGMLSTCLERIRLQCQKTVRAEFPTLEIQFKGPRENSTGKMNTVEALISDPGYLGKARVKMEFWTVSPEYLSGYGARASSHVSIKISDEIPAATLEGMLADKMVALGARLRIKWRDIFDIWWITNQSMVESINTVDLAKRVLFNASAYEINSLAEGWGRLTNDGASLEDRAERDLSPFLGASLSKKLFPALVQPMLQCARDIASKLLNHEPRFQSSEFCRSLYRPPARP